MLLEFGFQWLESLLCVLAAASKLSQHRYNRKPLLKRVKKKLNQPPPLHTSFPPPSSLLRRGA